MTTAYAVVIPTIGRPALDRLLAALDAARGPRPAEVIVVDDRPAPEQPLALPDTDLPIQVLRSGGRGPAAARNVGWRSTAADWICFLDDDVVPGPDWYAELAGDLRDADFSVVGSQGTITVPAPGRFSTTNGLPNPCSSFWPSRRARMSVPPDGAKGTMKVTGRFG